MPPIFPSFFKRNLTRTILWIILAVVVPLSAMTIYSWKIASENVRKQQYQEFQTLALENEKALEHRADSYGYALLGGAGFYEGSDYISKNEWHTYVQNLDIVKNFPGMRGMGLAIPVQPGDIPEFVSKMRAENTPHFNIHPETHNRPNNIIIYIEPEEDNSLAVGLNLGFEDNRLEAASLARDTGKAAFTKRIILYQSVTHEPGVLLLHPVYDRKLPTNTIEDRRQAHRGWIYAPFVAKEFLQGLTSSQGNTLNVRIYDGGVEKPENLIYNSDNTEKSRSAPQFTIRKQLTIMQQNWIVTWESTGAFEQRHRNGTPLFVLWGGLLFTAVFSAVVLAASVRRADVVKLAAGEKKFVVPIIIFVIVVLASCHLYKTLQKRELNFVQNTVEQESKKIGQLIFFQASEKLQALKRMGQRWNVAGRTPEDQWHSDARNYTTQLIGLKTIEWIDATNHVRWVEPYKGNEKALGLNILFDEKRKEALKGAAEKGAITVTPPLDLIQGYRGFIAYAPLDVNGVHDGFIAGIFSINEFIDHILQDEIHDKYAISIQYKAENLYQSDAASSNLKKSWAISRTISIYDKEWIVTITPTKEFVQSQLTALPDIILACGILIAMLLALTVRYILVSRVKSQYLLNREAQMRLLIKNTPAAVAMFDRDLRYIKTSDRWLQDYHLREEEIIGKSYYEAFPDMVNTSRWPYIHQRALQGEVFNTQEDSWTRMDGSREWVKWAIHPWMDSDDKIGGIVMFTEVITNAKIAEEALKRSNNLNLAIMDSAKSFIIATDNGGRVILFNKAAEKALGYTAAELVGIHTPALWHKREEIMERAQELTHELGRVVEPGFEVFIAKPNRDGVETREWTLVRRDGSTFPVSLTTTPLMDGDNNIIGYLGVIEDITERMLQQMALRISEETFRAAMEYASIGMALVDIKGTWLEVNQSMCDLLGYSKAEMLAMDFQTITHPDDLNEDMQYVQRLMDGAIANYQLEKRYLHKSGHVIWVLLSVSLVREIDGSPKYFVSQIQDITQQKEMDRIKSEFISVVSHELRTPLTSIRGSLGLIANKMAEDLPEKVNRLIQIAHENSERLILLINDILDIDKIASGQMRFDMKEEILAPIMQKAVEANNAYAEKFNLTINLGTVNEDIKVKVDSARLIQVLSNFLSNAAKFSPEGGRIDLSVLESDNSVRIMVRDYGPGIPEEFRTRIFGKFSQADSSLTRSKGGTGLGLHISKEIVEHMSGTIGFDTEMDKGTVFWAEFPKSKPGLWDHTYHIDEASLPVLGKKPSDLPKILHVEDDKGLIQFFTSALQDKAVVMAATTLAQAREYLNHEKFAMIVLDVFMPDGSGIDLLNYLHENGHNSTPIMILSAVEVPEDIRSRVASHMVKSRMSETKIIAEILELIYPEKDGGKA